MSFLAPFALLAWIAFAGGQEGAGAAGASDDVARSPPAELGPVRAWVEVTPAKPRLSDEPRLTLVIEAEPGVDVVKPPFGDAIGGFLIRDFHEPLPELPAATGGRQRLRQQYRLEPDGPGPHLILPIPIRFTDKRAGGDGVEHTLETEALTIEVTTLVAAETPRLAELTASEGPVEIPWRAPAWLLWSGGGVLGLAAALTAFLLWRSHRPKQKRPLSSTEIAQRELELLLEKNPFGRDDLKGFYVELTAIVRRHVERTTTVRAPEQTTGEFLRAIQGHPAFDELRRERLRAFLESADLVKFAGFTPESGAVEASVERAREFIRLFAPVVTETAS